jgi:hypothetical protein
VTWVHRSLHCWRRDDGDPYLLALPSLASASKAKRAFGMEIEPPTISPILIASTISFLPAPSLAPDEMVQDALVAACGDGDRESHQLFVFAIYSPFSIDGAVEQAEMK